MTTRKYLSHSAVFRILVISLQLIINVQCLPAPLTEQSSDKAVVEPLSNVTTRDAVTVKARFDGSQMWRITFDDLNKRNAVAELQKNADVETWKLNTNGADLFIKASEVQKAKELFEKANVNYDIIIEDVQRAIDVENPPADDLDLWQNRNGHPMTWTAYHRSKDINAYLDYLAKTYPDLCSVQTIGTSTQGLPLTLLRISNGKPTNPAIWIDGGIHAREWISPATVTYIIDRLVEDWDVQPAYIQNVDYYILPVANPDGYEFTHETNRLWRKNLSPNDNNKQNWLRCKGTDLNRNFGYHWGEQGQSQQPCSDIYSGKSGFSEPESKAQQNFFANSAAKFQAYLTFHSYGQYILYPWGFDRSVPADAADLDRVGKLGADRMQKVGGAEWQVGPSGTLLYAASGGSDDWAKSMNIKYSYTIELRDSGRYGFVLPASEILKSGKESMEFIDVVALAVSQLK